MAAQERETSDRMEPAGTVGALAMVAMVAAAVAVPVTAVAATVTAAAAATVKRRARVERPSLADTRDGPRKESPEPAAAD